jgi:hypothetical protein
LYRESIEQMLLMKGRNPQMDVSRTGHQAAVEDIFSKISLVEQLGETPMHRFKRKEFLQLN